MEVAKKKVCDKGHEPIMYTVLSEAEPCPMCALIMEHEKQIDEMLQLLHIQ